MLILGTRVRISRERMVQFISSGSFYGYWGGHFERFKIVLSTPCAANWRIGAQNRSPYSTDATRPVLSSCFVIVLDLAASGGPESDLFVLDVDVIC